MIKIVHGDCYDYLTGLDNKSIDLCLTDTPYGVGIKYDSYVDTEKNWYALINRVLPEMLRVSKMVIMPSCQIKRMKWIYANFPPDWLICWYKGSPGHAAYIGFNDWEPHLVYGRRVNNLYMHDYFATRSSPRSGEFGHPCPKPIEWSNWLISSVARKDKIVILDPFMGSGTVGVSAQLLGHSFVGCDISEKYCDIATDRIEAVGGVVTRITL